MGYYVHNKYDKASIDGLSTTGAGQELVDFYGEYEKYKYLDTSKGFGKVYDTLEYVTPGEETGGGTGSGTGSHFKFASSIIVKSIQKGVGSGATTISINTVKADKSVAFVIGPNAFLKSLSNTKLATQGSGQFSWQVLEYK